MTALAEVTTLKLGDIKQLIFACVQSALEDENSEFFKTCDELKQLRDALDPRELRSAHVKWHRKDNWLLVKKEAIDYNGILAPQDTTTSKTPYLINLEFDAGLYRAYVQVSGIPAPIGDIREISVLIGAFWPPEFRPPTGPIKMR